MGEPLGKLFFQYGFYKGLGAACQNGETYFIYPSGRGEFHFDGAQQFAETLCEKQSLGNIYPEIQSLIMRSREGKSSVHVMCKDGREFSVRDMTKKYRNGGEIEDDLAMSLQVADMTCGLEELPPPAETPKPTPADTEPPTKTKHKPPYIG